MMPNLKSDIWMFQLQVLIGTRSSKLRHMRGITLEELGIGDALKLLCKEVSSSNEELRELAERLGLLTLALEVSSCILAEGITPKELMHRLDELGAAAFSDEPDDPVYKKCPDLIQLFDISLHLVREHNSAQSHMATNMLKVGGWFAHSPIPLELLCHASAKLMQGSEEAGSAEDFRRLVRYSLGARTVDGSATFHQLVQDYGRHLGDQAAGKAMLKTLQEVGDAAGHAEHFQNACDLAIPPTRKPSILLDMTEQLDAIGKIAIPLIQLYTGASFQLSQASTLLNKCLEALPDQEFTLRMGLWGLQIVIYTHTWKPEEALQLCQKMMGIAILDIGPYSPEIATLLNNAASNLKQLGKYELAVVLFRMVLQFREKVLGSNGLEVAYTLNNLGSTLESQGKLLEALPLYKRSLRIREAQVNPVHSAVATALLNLGGLQAALGNYAEALQLLERARRISSGEQHPKLATILNGLGHLKLTHGRYEEAQTDLEEALPMLKEMLGPDHPDVAACLINMANLHRKLGNVEAALSMYKEALLIFEGQPGSSNNPHLAATLCGLGGVLTSKCKYPEALREYQRALQVFNGGEDNILEATIMTNMATSLMMTEGGFEGALEMLRRALPIKERMLGSNHPEVAHILDQLAKVQTYQDEFQDAISMIRMLREEDLNRRWASGQYAEVLLSLQEDLHLFETMPGVKPLEWSNFRYSVQFVDWLLQIRRKVTNSEHQKAVSTLLKTWVWIQ